jgi:pyridoxine kinase
MKRILTIQDISCVGKCSLTVALPIISAMGVETAVIPTAVLSTHTAFRNFTFKDLADQIDPICDCWKTEGIGFDGIYTGYLGSLAQIDMIARVFDRFKTGENMILVDPVMGDHGKLYPTFDEAFAAKMATLCAKADIIVPNITEACFMTGTEYRETYDEAYVKDLLLKLSKLGAKISVLTGVSFEEGKTGVMGYETANGAYSYYCHEKLPHSYHGTGDVFSSTCVGAMMAGKPWQEAVKVAADYTAECIRLTIEDPNGRAYGVNFEQAIPYLLERMK